MLHFRAVSIERFGMPAGTYVFTLYTISGTGNGDFTVTGSFTVTVYDSDDNFGVGDDQLADLSTTETGAAPVIQSLGAGAPAGWSVGDTFYFGGERGLVGGDTSDEYLLPKVGGSWQTQTALYSMPDATVPLVVGQSYTRAGVGSNVDMEVLPCFVAGTYIQTSVGEQNVEALSVGDMVVTIDHGLQPIRWIGHTKRIAQGKMAPILIEKDALGNTRDLLVSPQHRMLIQGWQAELLFGATEVLASAKSLVSDQKIRRKPGGEVCYYHILFDRHEIIFSEGIPSESFFPTRKNIFGFAAECRDEILELFPELDAENLAGYTRDVRMGLRNNEGEVLARMLF